MKVISIKQVLLANKLMEDFVAYCESGNVAKRTTVFKVLNFKTYNHQNPLHRMIARLAVLFLLERDIKADAHTGDFPEVLANTATAAAA